jgi:multiple sugar transport system permease protein
VSPDVELPQRARAGSTRATRSALALNIPMLAFLVYFFLPLAWLLLSATKSTPGLFSSFGFWFADSFQLFDNVRLVFTQDGGIFAHWLGNTVLYAVVSAGVATLLATAAGYAISRLKFTGRRIYLAIVLGSIMVPSTALTIPTYLLLSKIGMINTPLAIILPSITTPFGLYLMTVYAGQAIPQSLLEAARIDGASEYRILWRIALPQLAPGFATVLILTLVATWNNYFLPLIMLSDPKWYPLTLGLAMWNSQAAAGSAAQALFSVVITGSLLSIIPLIVAFLLLQHYWQSGLSIGVV